MRGWRALTVAPIDPDPALQITLGRIRDVALVTGALGDGGLAALLDTVALGSPGTLDLLGHTSGGLVQLGAWRVGDLSDPAILGWVVASGPALLARGISCVRVLGCGSAITPVGIAALAAYARALSERLGASRLRVYGTSQPLLASHFDAGGFKPGGPLVEVDDQRRPGGPASAGTSGAPSRAHRNPIV